MHRYYLCIVASLFASIATADNVQYSVVAFPKDPSSVAVSVGGQTYPLSQSQDSPYLFTGSAPSGQNYQYVIDGNQKESTQRTLAQGATSTGNEFFGRSRTVYDVPPLPQAYNPIYPTLFTGMNRSNEVATIIMQITNTSSLDNMLKNPKADNDDVVVDQMTYIASNELHKFQNATFKTSGQSTKDYAKQSYKVKFKGDQLLYGRSVIKLRAEETDMTMAREKLVMDCIAAAGGAVSSASWVRLYINNEPFGLYVMIDDASTHFIDNVLHGGDWQNPSTGPTYKGNALTPQQEGNLAYLGNDPTLYSQDLYQLEDKGENKTLAKDELTPLIGFMESLSQTQNISTLVDPTHTMIHMAFSFLVGSWDGFWYQASNYYLNQNLQTQQWALISYDFDETLGNELPDTSLMTVPYQQYGRPNATRPLIEKILAQYSTQFEDVLKTIIKRFFKPSVIGPRLQAWKDMLSEDIAWDLGIQPHSPGEPTNWTLTDFQTNLFNTTKSNIGILEWVQARSAAVCQQLNFQDTDDLPPLGPYTQGKYMDASGNISEKPRDSTNNGNVSPSGSEQNTSASSPPPAPFGNHLSVFLLSFIALYNLYYY